MNKYEKWIASFDTVVNEPELREGIAYRIVVRSDPYDPGPISGTLTPMHDGAYGVNGVAAWSLDGFWFTASGQHVTYDWYLEEYHE